MIPQEVRDLAAGIADDIEEFGHYQGVKKHGVTYFNDVSGPEKCCIVINPTRRHFNDQTLGFLASLISPDKPVARWNDNTPTPEVLATLRKIAAGETP